MAATVIHPNIPPSVVNLLEDLASDPEVEELILFGSRAIGDHNERSDVDVAVCGRTITPEHWSQIRETAYNARTLYRVGLVHFDKNPDELKARILSTGTKIYARPEAAR